MVMAKLHIICGNCGCNDNFELQLLRDGDEFCDKEKEDSAHMLCKNCSTIHNIKDNVQDTIYED